MKAKYDTIPLDRIKSPSNPLRSKLKREDVTELTNSIKTIGLIEPLVVAKTDKGFEVVAGHRRLLASEVAGLTTVPCLITEAKGVKLEILKLHENIMRSNISAVEWAKHLTFLKTTHKLSNAKLAEMLGMSEAWVDEHLKILNYPKPILEAVEQNTLTFSAARELAQIKDPVKREVYVRSAVKGGVTPAMAKKWRQQANNQYPQQNTDQSQSEESESTSNTEASQTPCPVCGENLSAGQGVVLLVHPKCQPKS